MFATQSSLRSGLAAAWLAVALMIVAACGDAGTTDPGGPPSGADGGTLTLARSELAIDYPNDVVEFDLASGRSALRFEGFDPHRVPTGETAYLAPLQGASDDVAVVVADARNVPGAPVYVCAGFIHSVNRICHTPRLSPNVRLVAFGTAAGGGSVCRDSYWGTYFADYVVVVDRNGDEASRFEGFYYPDWLPDGRLLMMGSPCRGGGVWVTDEALGTATRVDGEQISIPGSFPAVSPDGSEVLFVWSAQLWTLTLDGQGILTQLTTFDEEVHSGAWSPDGTRVAALVLDREVPVKQVLIFRPGDEQVSAVSVPFHPYGPVSWH